MEHALRLSGSTEEEDEDDDDDKFVNTVSDIEMDVDQPEIEEPKTEISGKNTFSESIPADTLVAALTLTGEGSEEWIIARIKSFDKNSYLVEDAEIEEEPSIEAVQKEYSIIKIYFFIHKFIEFTMLILITLF